MKSQKTNFIPVANPVFKGNELKYLTQCINTGWVSSIGGFVNKFQDSFAKYCGVKYGLAVSSGTAAIHLALQALEIGPGDEVIVPTLTFAASATPILFVDAKPVFIDANPETWNMDISQIEKKITKRTKAIIVVHLYGLPVDMKAIHKIAKKHNLFVIEDAAEAHGAKYQNALVGGLSDIACFSFYGNKTITTGEGGIMLTNNKTYFSNAKLYANHGKNPSKKEYYWHTVVGNNYAMTNIQAAVGLAQFEKIDHFLKLKRQNALYYNQLLKGTNIKHSPELKGYRNSYWLYATILPVKSVAQRNKVMELMLKKDIQVRPFFLPLHKLPIFKSYVGNQKFPESESLAKRGINLPSGVDLTKKDIETVVKSLKQVLTKIK